MGNQFLDSVFDNSDGDTHWKRTENDADALDSTGNALLDLFAVIGALRTRDEESICALLSAAFEEDSLLATKMTFYARNILGGLGERRTARIMWHWLATKHPDIMAKNITHIPKFGRYDDLYCLLGTALEDTMFSTINDILLGDLDKLTSGEPGITLLAKWLPSANASSKTTVKLALKTAQAMGMTIPQYRKTLSALREHIRIVERDMSANAWDQIAYDHVPSVAMNRYRRAFLKRDAERFEEFINAVKSGEKKINASTLYPYDIVHKILNQHQYDDVLQIQWDALPNYICGENNILVMADVSGSMRGLPMATSVGLAIYFAERNRGVFKDVFMTFSERPDFVRLCGENLQQKITNAVNAEWAVNTNFEAAMDAILRACVEGKVPQEDVPKALVVISDMEFDQASGTEGEKRTFYQICSRKFAEAGYKIPKVIFWNVQARQDTFHGTYKDGILFVSGNSPSSFKALINSIEGDAWKLMLDTLNDPLYDCIVIA